MKHVGFAPLLLAALLGPGCYSLTPQDESALETAERLAAGAYCGSTEPRVRALVRADHAEIAGVLRRSSVADAGATTDGGDIACP